MASIPKKTIERFLKEVSKFQQILQNAKNRDINEADTVTIVTDILCYIFGYDKYSEITGEFAIRGTYCDLAVKLDGNVKFLIEVKAIELSLKSNYIRQALDYGANLGIQWIILTNGIMWEIYQVYFEKPIRAEIVFSFNFLELNPRKIDCQEKLFLLCKEGLKKAAIDEFQEHRKIVNRFNIAAIILGETVLNTIRRELNKISLQRVEISEIDNILENEIFKRDVIDGKEAMKALNSFKRATTKKQTSQIKKSELQEQQSPEQQEQPQIKPEEADLEPSQKTPQ